MNINDHLIFHDKSGSLWGFNLADDNSLVNFTVSENGKSAEKGRIDIDVSEFAADINENSVLHFIYIKNSQIKYGKLLESGRWSSNTVYRFEAKDATVRELGLNLIDKKANIFYILQEDSGKNIGTVCHGLWNREKFHNKQSRQNKHAA